MTSKEIVDEFVVAAGLVEIDILTVGWLRHAVIHWERTLVISFSGQRMVLTLLSPAKPDPNSSPVVTGWGAPALRLCEPDGSD